MMYVLDASFFIETERLHLPLAAHPDFWDWLVTLAKAKTVAIPEQVYEELTRERVKPRRFRAEKESANPLAFFPVFAYKESNPLHKTRKPDSPLLP